MRAQFNLKVAVITTFLLLLAVSLCASVSDTYLSIEPSKESYTSMRYQTGEELGANWILVPEGGIPVENRSNTTLYVQESKDGNKWSDIIPFTYNERSDSWKAGKKIDYKSAPSAPDVIIEEVVPTTANPVEATKEVSSPPIPSITYLSIEPSKKSYTSMRYQAGEELGANWTLVTERGIPVEDKLNITLFVQESKDAVKWTDIIPYTYHERSDSWKDGKKINYKHVPVTPTEVEVEVVEAVSSSDEGSEQILEIDKDSSTTPLQSQEEIDGSWNVAPEKKIPIADKKNSTLYVLQSGDEMYWTNVTPFEFDERNGTWKGQKNALFLSSLDISLSYEMPLSDSMRSYKMAVGAGVQMKPPRRKQRGINPITPSRFVLHKFSHIHLGSLDSGYIFL